MWTKKSRRKIIFTGAERLGESKRTLLTFYKENKVQAREISYNIIATLQSLNLANDYTLIRDDKKIASHETRERESVAMQDYLDSVHAEWLDDEPKDDDGSISTLSSKS